MPVSESQAQCVSEFCETAEEVVAGGETWGLNDQHAGADVNLYSGEVCVLVTVINGDVPPREAVRELGRFANRLATHCGLDLPPRVGCDVLEGVERD